MSSERNFIKIAWKLSKYLPSFIYDLQAQFSLHRLLKTSQLRGNLPYGCHRNRSRNVSNRGANFPTPWLMIFEAVSSECRAFSIASSKTQPEYNPTDRLVYTGCPFLFRKADLRLTKCPLFGRTRSCRWLPVHWDCSEHFRLYAARTNAA